MASRNRHIFLLPDTISMPQGFETPGAQERRTPTAVVHLSAQWATGRPQVVRPHRSKLGK